jgi:hypothetical protein
MSAKMRRKRIKREDKYQAWIAALFARVGLSTENIPDIERASLAEIARSARVVADIIRCRQQGWYH